MTKKKHGCQLVGKYCKILQNPKHRGIPTTPKTVSIIPTQEYSRSPKEKKDPLPTTTKKIEPITITQTTQLIPRTQKK